METRNDRRNGLSALWMVYGVICIAKAAWIVVYSATLTLMWGAIINHVANPFFWMSAFHIWLTGAFIVLAFTALFSFLAAVALRGARAKGRAWTLVASVLAILTGPLGIALGAYTMVVTEARPAGTTSANYASAA